MSSALNEPRIKLPYPKKKKGAGCPKHMRSQEMKPCLKRRKKKPYKNVLLIVY